MTKRRFNRVHEVLQDLAADISGLQAHVERIDKEYVQSEDFEDLLEETLRRVSRERAAEKRRAYRRFLLGAIREPAPYDDQLELLRTLEMLQPEHLRVLAAIAQEPEGSTSLGGTRLGVLRNRMGGTAPEPLITELVTRLNDLRVTNLTNLKTFMTMSGAEATAQTITPFGWRLVGLLQPSDSASGRS